MYFQTFRIWSVASGLRAPISAYCAPKGSVFQVFSVTWLWFKSSVPPSVAHALSHQSMMWLLLDFNATFGPKFFY